jgi:hypothetical protein
MVEWLDESESHSGKKWSEAVVVYLKVFPGICLKELRKTTEVFSGDSRCPAEIRGGQKRYPWNNLLGFGESYKTESIRKLQTFWMLMRDAHQ